MATLYDIASQLNVSPGLVSGVLNGKNVRAREETRQKIVDLASELNYRPSVAAKALSSGRTMQIAALAGAQRERSMDNRTDLRGLVEAAGLKDYRVVVLPLRDGAEGCRQLENMILERVCDGLCLFSHQLLAPQLQAVAKHPIPCVVIGDPGECDWGDNKLRTARVDIDNYRYAWDSVSWLVSQGHRKIAYVRGSGEVEHSIDAAMPIPHQHHTYELQRGFRDAMREFCGEENPTLLRLRSEEDSVSFARSGAATAVIVRYLHGAMHWVTRLGMAGFKLPDDFTVLAQLEEDEASPLALASCLQYLAIHTRSHREVGVQAADVLLRWINGEVPVHAITLIGTNEPRWGDRGYVPKHLD